MVTSSDPHADGILIQTPGITFDASDNVVTAILGMLHNVFSESLKWAGDHELAFVAFLIACLLAFWIYRHTQVKMEKLKIDYMQRRAEAREALQETQKQLPLPLVSEEE